MATIPSFNEANLQALCDVLGATDSGLSGSEIGRCLKQCDIADLQPLLAKRYRLFSALQSKQRQDHCANNVIAFIAFVMNPVRHVGHRQYYETEREKINVILAFSGYLLDEDGSFKAVQTARTISEAEARASSLRKALLERRVHVDVLKFCKAELVADNYFHAVFEANKSIAEKLRLRTGLTSDGALLVDEALGVGKAGHPRLAFNALLTDSDKSEQSGLMNLIKGLFGAFRNTTAHAPKIKWTISEQDALDVLTTLSLVHRKLDNAVRTHIS